MRRSLGWALVFALPATLSSCGSGTPGSVIGTYEVHGTPQTSTCGVGPGMPNPWIFFIKLSRDTTTLYWDWQKDGSPIVSGPIDASAKATLSSTQTDTVGGRSPCSMKRDDHFDLALGTGDHDFAGTITYSFSVTDGTCNGALSSAGGPYDTLPCAMTYGVSGKRK